MHEYVQDADRAAIMAEVDQWAYKSLDGYNETDVLTFWVADDKAYRDPNYEGHPMSTFDVQTHEQFLAAMDRVISIDDAWPCYCRECVA